MKYSLKNAAVTLEKKVILIQGSKMHVTNFWQIKSIETKIWKRKEGGHVDIESSCTKKKLMTETSVEVALMETEFEDQDKYY